MRMFVCLLAFQVMYDLLADIYGAFLSHSFPPMGKYWVSVSIPLIRSVSWCVGGSRLQGCNGYLLPSARIVAQLHLSLRHQSPSSSNVDEVNSHKQVIFIDLHTRAKKKA